MRRPSSLAVPPSLGSLAAAIALAVTPAPAVASSAPGQVYGFGENPFGQLGTALGNGTVEPNPLPASLELPGAPVELAAGASHSLLVTATGQLYAFGDNSRGQLGVSLNAGTSNPNPSPTLVTLPGASGAIVHVAAGEAFSLAVTSSGQLYAFGENRLGQLGNATNAGTPAPNPTPMLVSLPGQSGPVVQVAAGALHDLALTSTGQVYTFGDNFNGELGREANAGTVTPNPSPAPLSLPGASGPAVAVAAGAGHSLVLTSTGQLFAFGDNGQGQLGTPASQGQALNPTPTAVALQGASGRVVQIAAGSASSLALTAGGQLFTFGSNRYGQLGRSANSGTANPNATAATVGLPGAGGPVVQLGANASAGFAVTASGQLFGFGANFAGQLGVGANAGSESPNPVPVQPNLPPGTTIDAVQRSSTASHTLALVADLAVLNDSLPAGQVGVPYTADASASGGVGARSWSAGGLPAGLSIDPASGQIRGTPTVAGANNAVLHVADAFGVNAASATIALTIAPVPRARISSTLTQAQLRSSLAMQLGIKGARIRIASLRKKRSYTYAFTALTAGTLVIGWYYLPPGAQLARRAKPVLFASGKVSFAHAGTKRIVLRLTSRALKLLRHRKSIKLTAQGSFTPRDKRAVTALRSFRLTR